jgi:hypothetical protein
MLPAPASIAAIPMARSNGSWNPAVPPPPVGGAAVGNGLGLGLDVGDGLGLAVGLGVGLGVALGDGLGDVDGERLGEPLAELLGVAVALVPGDDVVGSAPGGALPEQAETAMEASMARMPQLTAVNLVRSPVPEVAARPFTEPPHASGRSRARFRVPHPRKRRGPLNIKLSANDHAMACPPLEYQVTRAPAPGEGGGRNGGIG